MTTSLIALGSCFGSFINAACFRYAHKLSFISGRSECPHCRRRLSFAELLPVLGWLLLRGRCRDCKMRISPRYLLTELIGAAGFLLGYFAFGVSLGLMLALAMFCILLAIALIDLQTTEIPDGLAIALIPLAVAALWVFPDVSWLQRVIGFFAVAAPMFLMAMLIGGAFGGGDIKLMAVCGFLLGWQAVLLAFFVAVFLGGSYAAFMMLTKRRKRGQSMVFGPALCSGVFLAFLYGDIVIDWYLNMLVF